METFFKFLRGDLPIHGAAPAVTTEETVKPEKKDTNENIDVLESLQQHPPYRDVPIVACSNAATTSQIREAQGSEPQNISRTLRCSTLSATFGVLTAL
jgi:hypothetical protein